MKRMSCPKFSLMPCPPRSGSGSRPPSPGVTPLRSADPKTSPSSGLWLTQSEPASWWTGRYRNQWPSLITLVCGYDRQNIPTTGRNDSAAHPVWNSSASEGWFFGGRLIGESKHWKLWNYWNHVLSNHRIANKSYLLSNSAQTSGVSTCSRWTTLARDRCSSSSAWTYLIDTDLFTNLKYSQI